MRLEINTPRAKRNRRFANILTLLSIPVIFFSFFLVNPNLIADAVGDPAAGTLVAIVALLTTLAIVITAVKMTNKWVRPPRPENALKDGLKGVSNKSVLYCYYHKQAEHILVTQQGIFPIIIRFQDGRFTVTNDKWQTHKTIPGKLLGLFRFEGLGDPNSDAEKAIQYVKGLLTEDIGDVPIQPVIVFIHPSANVTIEDPSVPVVFADSKKKPNIKEYIRQFNKTAAADESSKRLNTAQMEALEKAIVSP
ncbi:MAG: hypothetical protein D6737_03885 [Chloroflexi bacterium]|nr:MAG: hypothetical protein D6737_03885 [Chloroflexota bacterium]